MRSEFTLPIGIKAEYDRDMDFGVCDKCQDVGVRLFKSGRGWVCSKCVYSRGDVEEVSPSN